MGLKKKEKDRKSDRINVRLTTAHLKHLRKLCIEMSTRDQKIYTVAYLIRETLLQAYPPPKDAQMDLFGAN